MQGTRTDRRIGSNGSTTLSSTRVTLPSGDIMALIRTKRHAGGPAAVRLCVPCLRGALHLHRCTVRTNNADGTRARSTGRMMSWCQSRRRPVRTVPVGHERLRMSDRGHRPRSAMPRPHRPCWSASTARPSTGKRHAATQRMVWRGWGSGPAVLLVHGGAGSWRHWVRNLAALTVGYTVIAPDLPGLGDSARAPDPINAEFGGRHGRPGLEQVIDAGCADPRRWVFLRRGHRRGGRSECRRPRSLADIIGTGGLGPPNRSVELVRVRDKTGAERIAAHRDNLLRMMLADPANVDALALEIQEQNTSRARLNSGFMWMSRALHDALPLRAGPRAWVLGRARDGRSRDAGRAHRVVAAGPSRCGRSRSSHTPATGCSMKPRSISTQRCCVSWRCSCVVVGIAGRYRTARRVRQGRSETTNFPIFSPWHIDNVMRSIQNRNGRWLALQLADTVASDQSGVRGVW